MAAIILLLAWNRNSFISKYLLAENLDWRLTQYLVLLLAWNRNLAALKIRPEQNPPQGIVYLRGGLLNPAQGLGSGRSIAVRPVDVQAVTAERGGRVSDSQTEG